MDQQVQIEENLSGYLPAFLKIDFTIQGFPEDVQRVADKLDAELVGEIEWTCFAETNVNNLIKLQGTSDYEPNACSVSRIAVFESLNMRCHDEVNNDFHQASSLSAFYCITTPEL